MARTHVVVSGDTLSELAQKFYGNADVFPVIAVASGIPDPDVILEGQVLTVPDIAQIHTVVSGDTLSGLADQFFGDRELFGVIAAFNGIKNANVINIGQVLGIPPLHTPLVGESSEPDVPGVLGANESNGGTGVKGVSESGDGLQGNSMTGRGVAGFSDTFQGVFGHSKAQAGVVGESEQFDGVFGIAHDKAKAGVSGHNPGGLAGFFDGKVVVIGDIEVTGDLILAGADYAEALSTCDKTTDPGTVVVVGNDGDVHACDRDYDSRVAGIVSGAGGVKPAIVLDRQDNSVNVALMGKVWCFADADPAPIRPGDMLTTSSTTGHCRRVTESSRAFGSVIGKALTALPQGRGLVRVLVSPR